MKKIVIILIIVLVFSGCQHPAPSKDGRKSAEARGLIIKGLEELNRKDIKNAILDLEGAIKADPSKAEAFFFLGQVFLREGQGTQAAGVFEYAARRSAELFSKDQKEEVFRNATVMALLLWRSLSAENTWK
jgi:Tfp pilus assembly protein PilF